MSGVLVAADTWSGHHPEAFQSRKHDWRCWNSHRGEEGGCARLCSEGGEEARILLQFDARHLFWWRRSWWLRGSTRGVLQVQIISLKMKLNVNILMRLINNIPQKISSICFKGLTEFLLRLILVELQQSCVFEGRPGSLFFTHDLTALDDRKYYEAGVLIGWSLTHGGRGPCLHPALYQVT